MVWLLLTKKRRKITDQKDLFDGAPVGLQVMGRRFEEEKIIGLMEAVSAALRAYKPSQAEEAIRQY